MTTQKTNSKCLPKLTRKEWFLLLLGVFLPIIVTILWGVVFSPDLVFVFNRIYVPEGESVNLSGVEGVIAFYDGKTEFIYVVSNPSNLSSAGPIGLIFPGPANFATRNQTYYELNIYNKGLGDASSVKLRLVIDPPVKFEHLPPDVFVNTGTGEFSNDFSVRVDNLKAGDSIRLHIASEELSNVTPEAIYVGDVSVPSSKILVIDSVLIPSNLSIRVAGCHISGPNLSDKYENPVVANLVIQDPNRCKYEWVPVRVTDG